MKRINLFFFILTLFLFSNLELFSQGNNNLEVKKPDYIIDLDRRWTMWLALSGHGWLYQGCQYQLSAPIPEYASSGDPLLQGKLDSEDGSHFLFRFRTPGDYHFSFFYQDFEPVLEDEGSGDIKTDLSQDASDKLVKSDRERMLFVRVIDSHKELREGIDYQGSLPVKRNQLPMQKEKRESRLFDVKEVASKNQNKIINNENPIAINDKRGDFNYQTQSLKAKGVGEGGFLWKKHPLFPSMKLLKQLKTSSQTSAGPIKSDRDAFCLGLYYFSLQSPSGIKKSLNWFKFLVDSFPASEYAEEAEERADYIKDYYLLIR